MPPVTYIVQSPDQAAWTPPGATSDDTVLILANKLRLLDSVAWPMTVGVVWSSWADAQTALAAGLDPRIGVIGWGIEYQNPAEPLPADEAADIPGWLITAAADAENYGRDLLVVPDNYYAKLYGKQIATSATSWVYQVQRYQNDTNKVAAKVKATLGAAGFGGATFGVQTDPGSTAFGGLDAAIGAWDAVAGINGVTTAVCWNRGDDASWVAVQAFIAAVRPTQG